MGHVRDSARLQRRAESRARGAQQGMNPLRYGPIVLCGLLALAGFLLSKRPAGDGGSNAIAPAGRMVATLPVAGNGASATVGRRRAQIFSTAGATEFPEGPDTSGLQESLTIDGLIDEVNADSGDGFMPVDPSQFGDLLRSDPALRKAMAD
jgi:hypothetical protein